MGTGKQAKGAKLSKEQKHAASLLKKLKAIEKGGDINAVDKLGQTALMYAAARGNRLAVCWLVAKGADASIKSKSGKTAGDLSHGDLSDFLTALEKEKQPLSRQEARDMLTYRGVTLGEIEKDSFSEDYPDEVSAIPLLRGTTAENLNKLKNKEWKIGKFYYGGPMKLALLYRIGARKFILPEDLSSVADVELLQLLRSLGTKVDVVDPALQMKIALQLKQTETALELLKKDPPLLQNPDIFSSISDEKTLQALLGAGLDAKNETLMEAVIEKGDGEMLRTLLKAGATLQDPDKTLKNVMDRGGDVLSGDNYRNANFVLALIDAGAKTDVNPLTLLLHRAANRVNLSDVKLLLARGANPNATGDDQMTPLMSVANSSTEWTEKDTHRTEIVKHLLAAGADIHAKDSKGKGVIYYAACGGHGNTRWIRDEFYRVSKGAEADILRMVEQLLKAGADVPKDILAQELRQEISLAGREKLALMLLDAGADPLAKAENGCTTLMVNGIWGGKIAKRLLDAGVDPCVKFAADSWETSTGDDRNLGEDGDANAMSLAMAKGTVEVVKLLKEKGIDPGELQIVDPEKIEPLLKLGARIPESMELELLFDRRQIGHSTLLGRPFEDYVDIIQILKQHGYKPDLMAGTKKLRGKWMRILNLEAYCAFLKAGENPNETDENGNSLLANFVSSTAEVYRGFTTEVLPAFIEAGVDVNKPIDQDGQTPIFYAGGDAKLISQLLRAGASVRVRDAKGRTPLFYNSESAETVRLLMQRGVRINAQDNEGNTALMMAVTENGSGVQALLDSGANPNIKNKAGKTALQIAKEKKCDSSVEILEKHGAKE